MPPEQWAHAIAASVAPVVIISAAALLCLGLYNRLAMIISRIRAVQRERLDVQERMEALNQKELEHGSAFRLTCIMEGLADQTARIRRRARLIRNSLLCLLGAIGSLVICSLINGVTIFYPSLAPASAVAFVLGLLLVLGSVVYAAQELILALAPAELETDLVSELTATGSSDMSSAAVKLRQSLRADLDDEPSKTDVP